MNKNVITKIIILSFLLCFNVNGCAPVVAGAAVGVAGTVAVYDHQTIKETMQDHKITRHIVKQLKANPAISKQCHVRLTTYHRTVLLVGQAPTQQLKDEIEDIARSASGIRRLYNEITIGGPTSTLTRTSDTWLTTKVKSRLLATKGLKSGQIKVLTEDSVVFLIGIVSYSQADLAVRATKQIDGVGKVVKVFQITSPR